jgi:hypothetical protein
VIFEDKSVFDLSEPSQLRSLGKRTREDEEEHGYRCMTSSNQAGWLHAVNTDPRCLARFQDGFAPRKTKRGDGREAQLEHLKRTGGLMVDVDQKKFRGE